LYAPGWVAVDGAGNLFIAGIGNIRKVSNGIITTITGNGSPSAGYSGDGPASSATGAWGSLAVGGMGNLFIALGGHVRKISLDGMITTLDGVAGLSIASDRAGNVYVPDPSNNVVRILRPVNGPFYRAEPLPCECVPLASLAKVLISVMVNRVGTGLATCSSGVSPAYLSSTGSA
jgi:hypothetical protein